MPHPSITAQTYPHKPAIIMGDSGELVTYRQLDQRSNQGAQLFRALGLRTGDHIGMMLENTRQFLEIAWAAQRSGIIFTPISTHLKQAEAAYILENCGARLFIGSLALADIAEQIIAAAPGQLAHFYMVGGIRPGFESWEVTGCRCSTLPVPPASPRVCLCRRRVPMSTHRTRWPVPWGRHSVSAKRPSTCHLLRCIMRRRCTIA
jgi:acyl-CoA synthetase (AMP-forming)/AMP-acid ligase II